LSKNVFKNIKVKKKKYHTKGVIRSHKSNNTDNAVAHCERTNRQAMVGKTVHRKLKIEQNQDSINVREYRRANQKWTIKRNWQQDEEKNIRNKICAGHHYS
jgi:hypothetical protein